ncbi:MAG: hypothetical protein ACRDD1_08135, partial [Planctomycetia bacterium]
MRRFFSLRSNVACGLALGVSLAASTSYAVYVEGQPTELGGYGEGVLFITTIDEPGLRDFVEGVVEASPIYPVYAPELIDPVVVGGDDPDAWIAWSGAADENWRGELDEDFVFPYDETVIDDPSEELPSDYVPTDEEFFVDDVDPTLFDNEGPTDDFDESLIY